MANNCRYKNPFLLIVAPFEHLESQVSIGAKTYEKRILGANGMVGSRRVLFEVEIDMN